MSRAGVAICVLWFAVESYAQLATSTSLVGSITDDSGALVPGGRKLHREQGRLPIRLPIGRRMPSCPTVCADVAGKNARSTSEEVHTESRSAVKENGQ
jgi:hypothetical protein